MNTDNHRCFIKYNYRYVSVLLCFSIDILTFYNYLCLSEVLSVNLCYFPFPQSKSGFGLLSHLALEYKRPVVRL